MNTLIAPLLKFKPFINFKLTGLSLLLWLISVNGYCADNAQVTKDNINVRIDATVASPSLGALNKGEKVSVVENRFEWSKIILPKRFSAYASSQFLKKLDDNKVEVITTDLNLRNQPSISSYIIGKADKGTVFFYRSESKGWVEIRGYPYAYGWVNKNFLKELKEPITLTGVILPLKSYDCEANCILKASGAKYLLNLLYKGKAKFMHKKVRIEGAQIKGKCAYVVVYKLAFVK